MKNYKLALLAALGLASVVTTQAQDLLLGFNDANGPTTAQNDYVIDLGVTTSQLLSDAAGAGGTYNLGAVINANSFNSAFSSDGNAANEVAAGIVGTTYPSGSPVTIAITGSSVPTTFTSGSAFNTAGAAAAGVPTGVYASNGQSAVNTGWTFLVAQSPTQAGSNPNGTSIASLTSNPMGTLPSDVLTIGLYEATRGGSGLHPTAGAFSEVGTFTINASTDNVSFTAAVPEPSTYGVLAAGGLLIVSLRRQMMNKIG